MNTAAEETLQRRFTLAKSQVIVAGRTLELVRPRSIDELIDEEDFGIDERLPYWADLWPSARVLADRVAREAGQGRTLLELGCGLGLVSLAASLAGFSVLATDYYGEALEFVTANAERNQLPEIDTRLIDWRRWPGDLGEFDLVVASDVLFERPNAALVAAGLARSLAPRGLGLITDPGRQIARSFPDECAARQLACECVQRERVMDGQTELFVELFEVRRVGS